MCGWLLYFILGLPFAWYLMRKKHMGKWRAIGLGGVIAMILWLVIALLLESLGVKFS